MSQSCTGKSNTVKRRKSDTDCSKPELDLKTRSVFQAGTGLELAVYFTPGQDWNWTGRSTQETDLLERQTCSKPELDFTGGELHTGTGLELDRVVHSRTGYWNDTIVPSRNWTLQVVNFTPGLDWNWTGRSTQQTGYWNGNLFQAGTGLLRTVNFTPGLDWNWTGWSTQELVTGTALLFQAETGLLRVENFTPGLDWNWTGRSTRELDSKQRVR
ncbi:hypothetical protein SKAU_G00251610 [Synaphobranchus kaupii]|uniref:Uncharacterized protein n=1 Tax=Synaphobranchus kaupii TaxID=118154 RepID=A0A9Q1IR05_SYNKA|nr:hypothetical protein SKAU_G00251610 [Synaphobranchus kaupii]